MGWVNFRPHRWETGVRKMTAIPLSIARWSTEHRIEDRGWGYLVHIAQVAWVGSGQGGFANSVCGVMKI